MKILIRLVVLIFFMILSSCYSDLEFRDYNRYPNHKNDEMKPAAVIIDVSFINESFSFTKDNLFNVVSFDKIKSKIKTDLDKKFNRPVVYFSYENESQVNTIKDRFDKVIFIKMKVSKSLNFTGALDAYSVAAPIPAPQWGNYLFDTNIKITSKANTNIQEFNYSITSDFSYMFFPLYRNDAQLAAIKRGVNKLLVEMFKNDDLVKLFDKDGEISFAHNFSFNVEEVGGRLIQHDKYSDFPFAIDVRTSWGYTSINGYYTGSDGTDTLGASGDGYLKEYHIQASTFKPVTQYNISPTFGYYYQEIEIEDFAEDTRSANEGKTGFIPGKVEERDSNGNIVNSSDSVYSLGYDSQFSSTYLGGELGLNLVYGDTVQFIFYPLIYFSIIEARHTTIVAGGNEFSDWSFPFFGMVGFKFETGLFFSDAHFGIKFGYDLSYFRKYDFPHNIKFNTNVVDENGIFRSKKIEVDKFDVFSNKFFVDVFILF